MSHPMNLSDDTEKLKEAIKDLMGYGGYTPNSRYDQLYEIAKATVRKRDKPEYQETMHQLADEEFAVLIVDEMMSLFTRVQVEELESLYEQRKMVINGKGHSYLVVRANTIKERIIELKASLKGDV